MPSRCFRYYLENDVWNLEMSDHCNFKLKKCLKFCMSLTRFRLTLVLPGHLFLLQSLLCLNAPSQSLPPWAGAGLSHLRVLECSPTPHVLLHLLHMPHSPQFPFTMKYKLTRFSNWGIRFVPILNGKPVQFKKDASDWFPVLSVFCSINC